MSDKKDLRKKISSKAISALIMEDANRMNAPYFIRKAYRLVFETPDKLTEEWVRRINSWAKQTVKDMNLDSDILKKGQVLLDLGPLTITKIIHRHSRKAKTWPGERFLDFIAVDSDGWKYWFRLHILEEDLKSGNRSFPSRDDEIIIRSARVRDIRTGITFLAEPHEVRVINK